MTSGETLKEFFNIGLVYLYDESRVLHPLQELESLIYLELPGELSFVNTRSPGGVEVFGKEYRSYTLNLLEVKGWKNMKTFQWNHLFPNVKVLKLSRSCTPPIVPLLKLTSSTSIEHLQVWIMENTWEELMREEEEPTHEQIMLCQILRETEEQESAY